MMKKMIDFIVIHKMTIITFIGTLIVAFGAFKSSIDRSKAEKKLNEANEVIQEQTTKIRNLTELTIALQDKTIEELIHQTSMITGGNTYPILVVSNVPENPHMYTTQLFAVGKYPLHNFSMQINSQNHTEQPIETSLQTPEIKQSSPVNIKELLLDIKKNPNLKLIIRFSARNGTWIQEIEFRKTEDELYQHQSKVYSSFDKDNPLNIKKFEDESTHLGSMANLESLKYQR